MTASVLNKVLRRQVLFFEDTEAVKKFPPFLQDLIKQFPECKFLLLTHALINDRFSLGAEHSNGMNQFIAWTALNTEGLGANLQHYNPLIDERVAKEWGVPATWQLTAQLVFGGKGGEAGQKDHKPLEEIFKVAGA